MQNRPKTCKTALSSPSVGRALGVVHHLPIAFILRAGKSLPSQQPFVTAPSTLPDCCTSGRRETPSPWGFNPSPPSFLLLLPPTRVYIPVKRSSVGVRRREGGLAWLHLQTYSVKLVGNSHGRAGSAWGISNTQRLLHGIIH